jgi:hypothetical protein
MLKKDVISSIEGKPLNGYVLHIGNLFQGRFIEETNFKLYLEAIDGETSENPVVKGKYFSGRGKFYKPWLEIYYYTRVKFKSSKIVDLSERELDKKLFNHLSAHLSPGGHFMVVYLNHEETRKGLEQGVPAPATPIGYLLWKSGCTSFKDWYFAEGFWEGDVKLQGNKPVSKENRRKDLLETHKKLTEFLKKEKRRKKLFLDARKRAENLLKDMREISPRVEIM